MHSRRVQWKSARHGLMRLCPGNQEKYEDRAIKLPPSRFATVFSADVKDNLSWTNKKSWT